MKKKLLLMTSIGLLPYEAINKEYLPKEAIEAINASVEEMETITEPSNIEFYIDRLARRKKWDYKKMLNYLRSINKMSPAALFNILSKEIAVYLDENHEGLIKDSEQIWAISITNGKVYKEDKASIKNYRNFAAFRTQSDAKFARKVLSSILKEMFKGCGEQEDKKCN